MITSVTLQSSTVQIQGTLTSKPNTLFAIELFGNPTNSESGQYYLGTVQAATDAGGNATFDFSSSTVPSGVAFFTATATDPSNNTSVFSAPAS